MSNTEHNSDLREVVLVGCGNMGFALLKGWLPEESALKVHVVEPHGGLRDRAAAAGASAYLSADAIPADIRPQAIVMAVKPQHVALALADYRGFVAEGALILSVAAGVTITAMEAAIKLKTPIVRCMPNTPASIGAGALVCCLNTVAGDRHRIITNQLLSPGGEVHFIGDEGLMDAVTAVSGSGPAYVFNFIEALIAAAIAAGLPHDLARRLAVQTIYGASLLARDSDQSPTTLREQVTSPNGTTAAALAVLMAPDGLGRLINEAVAAAKGRSIELGR